MGLRSGKTLINILKTTWLVLSDEERKHKIAFFPTTYTTWRANEQLAGDWALASYALEVQIVKLYSLDVISSIQKIGPQLLGMKITDYKSILQQVVRTPTSWRWGRLEVPVFQLPSALDSLDHFNLPMGFGSPWRIHGTGMNFTYIIRQIYPNIGKIYINIPYMDPVSNDASGMMTNLRLYFWTSVGSFWLQEYDIDQHRSI